MTDAKQEELPGFQTAAALAAAPAQAGPIEKAGWAPPEEWSRAWQDLVLDLVDPARKLSELDIAYFFTRAKKLALDPLARQIFPLARNGRVEVYVGIHGIRAIAQRTGERGDELVIEREYGTDKVLRSVTVQVIRLRGGTASHYPFRALLDEFKPKRPLADGDSWKEKPEVMLTKCAAANAYRMAFPEVLGGLYIPEETE